MISINHDNDDVEEEIGRIQDGMKLMDIIEDISQYENDEDYDPTDEDILEMIQKHGLSLEKYAWISLTMLFGLSLEIASYDHIDIHTFIQGTREVLTQEIKDLSLTLTHD